MAETLFFTGQVNDAISFTGDGTASQLIATGTVAATGPQGIQGIQGATGAAGTGVIAGGTTGQVLAKTSATDYATAWSNTYSPGGTDVAITDGGTGVSTLPTGILKGAGTGAITAVTAPTGTVVGTTDTQTLTGKTMSGASNTFSLIPTSAVVNLSGTNTGDQTNVTGTAGTITGVITESQVTNLVSDLAAKASSTEPIAAARSLIPTAIKTANYTAVAGDFVLVDATAGPITITAPALAVGVRWGIRLTTAVANAVTASTGTGTFDTNGTSTLTMASGTGTALLDVTWAGNTAGTQWVGTSSGKPNSYLSTLYQQALTLTTTGTSGAATLASGTLNIPQYTGGGAGTPGGSTTQLQYNNAGAFAGLSTITTDGTSLLLGGSATINSGGAPTGYIIATKSGSSQQAIFVSSVGGSGGGAGIIGSSDNGAATASGDRLGFFLLSGARDASHSLFNAAGMIGMATQAWTGTASGSQLVFQTTPNNTASRVTGLVIDQDQSSSFSGTVRPATNATYTLGDTTHYWTNEYTTRLNLNSTAFIDGTTAGTLAVTGTVSLGTPLALTSGGTGSATQNFVDLTTAQTVAGVKTFTSAPIINMPTMGNRLFVTVPGTGNSIQSALVINNSDTTTAGAGMLFSAGATTAFISGLTAARTDASTNSVLAFRILANSALTAADASAPLSIAGVTSGNNIVNVNADVIPYANATNAIGNTTRYFTNSYITRWNANSTAFLDGTNAGKIVSNAEIWGDRGFKFGAGASAGTDPLSGVISGVAAYVDAPVFKILGFSTQTTDLMRVQTGASTAQFVINASSQVGLLANGAPTHTLTLGSTATGIALYNTSDQTTNYERLLTSFVSNVATIQTQAGGTGTGRSLALTTSGGSSYILNNGGSTSGYIQIMPSKTMGVANINAIVMTSGVVGVSTGQNNVVVINPTINASGSNATTILLVNPTQTAIGSGGLLLADFQVGATSKLSVDNTGKVTKPVGAANSSVGTATLIAGTVTVSTTSVTASSIIYLTVQSLGTVTTAKAMTIGTKTAATSFVITSADATDTSIVGWMLIN